MYYIILFASEININLFNRHRSKDNQDLLTDRAEPYDKARFLIINENFEGAWLFALT